MAKKESLTVRREWQAAGKPTRLTPEELAEKRKAALTRAREARKAQKAKREALESTLAEKCVSIDELLEQVGK